MKKTMILLGALLLSAVVPTQAQDWKEALKKVATAAADKATDGKLTRYAILGEWNYSGPGVKFESDDIASELGGAALQTTISQKLDKAYRMAGIEPGACTFRFDDENSFTAQIGNRTLSGTYEFDASTHTITLHFAKGKYNLGSVPGHAYISGSELQLVFPITKLIKLVTQLGSKISSLSTVSKLLEKYENVYLGFEFTK